MEIEIQFAGRKTSSYYVVPRHREFANVCKFAYGVTNTRDAEILAEYYDGRIVDEDDIEVLQKNMHLAEGCTSKCCAITENYSDECDDGNNCCDTCCKEILSPADEFVDHVDVQVDEQVEEQ